MNPRLNDRLKNIYNYLILFLKERAIFCLALLLTAAVIAAGFVFYSCVLKNPDGIPTENVVKIDRALYQKVLDDLTSREANIQQGLGQNYPDIFR